MNDAADTWSDLEILEKTNAGDYDPTENPCGWDADGLPENLERHARAVAGVGKTCAQYLQMLLTYLQSANGWAVEARTVTRISDTQFAVAGLVAGEDLTGVYKARRSVSLIQGVASGFAWVLSSAYEAGPNRTVVTITRQTEGLVVAAGLTAVWFGQDPSNAPKPSDIPTQFTPGAMSVYNG